MSFTKNPTIKVKNENNACFTGWEEIGREIHNKLNNLKKEHKILVIETYQGVNEIDLLSLINNQIKPDHIIHSNDYMFSEDIIREMTQADVTDDRVFGYLTRLNIVDYIDHAKMNDIKPKIAKNKGLTVVYGSGASIIAGNYDVLVYADMARWEIQQRMRRNEVDNLGITNKDDKFEVQYKRSYFVDWRVIDRLKKKLMTKWDYILDTNKPENPKLVKGSAILNGLRQAVQQPFSVVPFFDPGPWGGQWMRDVCDLNKEPDNFAWCFNCVPEENSLLLQYDETVVEIPSINLVFYQAKELLGEAVHGRFGDEFPIRFDYLDTMDGGNLSLQVHPLTEYIQEKFGMHYTQDESYYMMDAKPGAKVYLGLQEGINPQKMIDDLRKAEKGDFKFNAEKYAGVFDAKKHDHFLIPGGTVHCSGKDSMVLEISSTPYIFTFKLWDWGRLGMDGKPRPINVEHGKNVIQWDRTSSWTEENLVNQFVELEKGDGWREEKTGLHEREFIETRRHWFTKKVHHNTDGGVHVLCLVEGQEAIVESPSNTFDPFVVNYAEVFVVPAKVGEYTIKPHGVSKGKELATMKAYVRTNC